MIIGARFPGRYLQGPGIVARLGQELAGFGTKAIIVLDRGVYDLLADTIRAACDGHLAIELIRHGGECSKDEIALVTAAAKASGARVVLGAGGGKALDTAKAAAHEAGIACVVMPTIAASDAPCSALAVVYKPDGSVDHDYFLPRNPDLVMVDTEIVAKAPARFLAAGIGDALATWYEAEACRRSGALNCLGVRGVPLAYEIARICRDTVFEFGVAALAECDAKVPGPAFERIVEANILLSGLGFESGGVAGAHAIHHGLSELDEVHHHLHGEKVAIGVLAELKLQGVPEDEYIRVRDFCAAVRLPTRLRDIGITDATEAKLRIIAERACRPGEIMHNEAMPVTAEMVVQVLRELV
ncbi:MULTISPECIES: glycerol dehydrogenase [unclassified Inquilinus]|uniref:glycerol dehydrogenase n=1 Tax=unclassified Inquilinus TaxID=2645927 RepID=UPI003F902F19